MAAKRKVHEVAKSLGRTSKELIEVLQRIGVDAKAANSVVKPEDEAKLRAHLFGIKDREAKEQPVVVPEMAKPEAAKVRLRKKAPRETMEEPAPAAVAAEEAGTSEQAPKEAKAEPAEGVVEPPAEGAAEGKPAAAKGEATVEEKAKAGKVKKAPRPEKADARVVAQEEILDDRGATVAPDALRRLTKPERVARPRGRRGGRGRADKGARGKRGVPERSHAYGRKVRAAAAAEPKVAPKKKVRLRGEQTLAELAFALDAATEKVEAFFRGKGRSDLTPLTILTVDEQAEAAREMEFDVDVQAVEPKFEPRRAVVAVLGHVDHGKTTLLDAIRKTNVVATESGGITQHVGASVAESRFGDIVFIDTPGHEIFTQMRARGAHVTDVVVLVVAADDGVMPQTLESVSHAKAAHVPVVVAITKMDKTEADALRVKRGLAEHGVTTEDWGGEVLSAEISALRGEGLEKLLEAISLQSEIMELKADVNARTRGVVIESTLDRGRGVVVTVLVQQGVLKVGDAFVAGRRAGRVRAMFDTAGKKVKEAGPSTPVSVLGAEGLPGAGDILVGIPDDKTARSLAALLTVEGEAEKAPEPAFSLDEWYRQLEEGGKSELNLVIKADVAGSAEALVEHLGQLGNEEVSPKILHTGVGSVSESDVLLAGASEGVLVAYRVGVESKARKLAQREGVEIRYYDVIYETIEDVRAALEGLLEPEIVIEVVGTAEVRQVFDVSSSFRVAGCMVTGGRVFRGAHARVLREGEVVHEGTISSLRRFRDDVKEVQQGLECGIVVSNFAEVAEGDVVEVLGERKVARHFESK
ncbi:MAG: translation initiation factor IF-2 [bacterium]